jgi:NADH:ubiquinone oxidoreductase subunit 2 (subunit N)
VIFIGLETLSLCFYVLAAFFRTIEAPPRPA